MIYATTKLQEQTIFNILIIFDPSFSTRIHYEAIEWLINNDIANNPKVLYSRQVFWYHAFEAIEIQCCNDFLENQMGLLKDHINYQATYDFLKQIIEFQSQIYKINTLWNTACKSRPKQFNDDYLMELLHSTTFFEYVVKRAMFTNIQNSNPEKEINVSDFNANEKYDNIFKSLIFSDL